MEFTQDTITLSTNTFKKTAALVLKDAVIYLDFHMFRKQLHQELKGCAKRIRKLKKSADTPSGIFIFLPDPLKEAQRAFSGLDSAYEFLKKTQKGNDTLYFSYEVFFSKSRFGDFLPNIIESDQCTITDRNFIIQSSIIRQKGWSRTGAFSAGSTLYFLPGYLDHFWARWDWST